MVTEKRISAALVCECFECLMKGEKDHVILIVDGHPSHKAKKIQEHEAKWNGRLRLNVQSQCEDWEHEYLKVIGPLLRRSVRLIAVGSPE